MSDPFIQQLVELCQRWPVQPKWVFVPNQGRRWNLAERLLLEGCNWVNLRLVTPFQLALEAVAPDLVAQGIHPCPESLGPSLMLTLMHRPETKGGHFSEVLEFPGTAEALWRTLCQFRMAGLNSTALDALPNHARRNQLRALFGAYEQTLDEQRLADRADILRAIPRHLPIHAEDPVVIDPYHRWSFLEMQWMQRAPGHHQRPWGPAAGKLPLGWVERQRAEVPLPPGPSFFWAVRRSEEVGAIARQLLEQHIALDQVEIAAHESDEACVAERLAAMQLPCTFEAGIPALHTRPGQALQRLLQWLESGCSAYHLSELLKAELLQAPPSAHQAAGLLEGAQVHWGRHTYLPRLEALERSLSQRDDRRVADLQAFKQWLKQLFQRFPQNDHQPNVDFRRWLAGLQETLIRDGIVEGQAQGAARKALVRMLEEMKQLPGEHWPVEHGLLQIQQRLQNLKVLASRPRPGWLHICRPENLGLSGRNHLFWIGVEEGRVERNGTPDCVLDDEERQQLSPWLPLAAQRNADFQQHLRDRLLTRRGQITLSCAQLDEAGEQPQLPAWMFFDQARQSHPTLRSYEELFGWLELRQDPPLPPADPEALRYRYPWLARAFLAEQARGSCRFTVFDGWVTEAAGRWDPRQGGGPISVSRLQQLATCPFQFFLEHGLGLRPPSLELPNPDGWLDAATRGSLLHDVFAAYYRGLRQRGWRPEGQRDRRHLAQLLDEHLKPIREVLPPPSLALEKAERRALLQQLERFLQLELTSPERQPIALEVGFGMGPDDCEELTSSEPIEVVVSPNMRLKLRGRIDRLDRLPDGYAVVDYKTGRKLYTARSSPRYDRGRLLQHALYALVAEELLARKGRPGRVVQSSYYFPTTAAETTWVHLGPPQREELEEVLQWVMEPLRSGVFVHTHEVEKDCRFCPYRAACEAHDPQAIHSKLDNPDNQLLEFRRRLLEVR